MEEIRRKRIRMNKEVAHWLPLTAVSLLIFIASEADAQTQESEVCNPPCNFGNCVNKKCVCFDGYTGVQCETACDPSAQCGYDASSIDPHVTCTSSPYGNTVEPDCYGTWSSFSSCVCDTYYTISSAGVTYWCSSGGSWSPDIYELKCYAPCIPDAKLPAIASANPVLDRQVVQYSCPDGYSELGTSVVTCNDGVWDDHTIFECLDNDPCAEGNSPCQNGGTCTSVGLEYNCSCPWGYTDKNCETDTDECYSNPCNFGGTCVGIGNEFKCECAPGYEGDFCETDTDECYSNPCQFGGTCSDFVNKFKCDCAPGYEGDFCERVPPTSETPPLKITFIIATSIFIIVISIVVVFCIVKKVVASRKLQVPVHENMTLEISSPAASTLRGPVHSSEGFIYYSRRLPLEAATVAYESSISDPNYSLVPEYQGDYYSKVQDKTSKNRNFKAKDMCLIINIKLGPVYNIWMGTIALDNDTNKSVVISTATDQILQSQEIHWDEYVKRVLDLPSNKNLVSVVGICIDTVNLYLLHEHVACETLDKRIQSTKILEDWKTNLMTPSEVLSYVKGILEGLELVHSYGFLHPGLTTKKILVTDQGECKLYDFCLSKDAVAKVAIAHTQMLNNLNHFAPETLLRNTYTQACDVWSIGVVIWEICSGGSHPFPATEESITRLKQLPLPPDKWPDEYQALKNRRVFDCWEEEVSLRPSLNQLRLSFSKISDSLEHYDCQPTVGASLEHVEDFSDVNILRTPVS